MFIFFQYRGKSEKIGHLLSTFLQYHGLGGYETALPRDQCLLWLPTACSVAIIVFAERIHDAQLVDEILTCCSQRVSPEHLVAIISSAAASTHPDRNIASTLGEEQSL